LRPVTVPIALTRNLIVVAEHLGREDPPAVGRQIDPGVADSRGGHRQQPESRGEVIRPLQRREAVAPGLIERAFRERERVAPLDHESEVREQPPRGDPGIEFLQLSPRGRVRIELVVDTREIRSNERRHHEWPARDAIADPETEVLRARMPVAIVQGDGSMRKIAAVP
jgi:hypothetical protein